MAESEVKVQQPAKPAAAAPAKKKKPKELAVIDQAGCTGCEVCLEFCPVDCIYVVSGPDYNPHKKLVEIDLDICIGCKLCVKYCPWDTIEMIPTDESYDVAREWTQRTVLPEKEWMQGAEAEVGQFFPTIFYGEKPEV